MNPSPSVNICRQEYDYTKLLALSESGTQYIEEFTFPSGCKCYQTSHSGYTGYRWELARTEEINVRLPQLQDDDDDLSTPRNMKGIPGRGKKKQRKQTDHQNNAM